MALKEHELKEFSEKYQTFFKCLTNPDFVRDADNLMTMQKIIALKAKVDTGEITEEEAQSETSRIAMERSLSK